MDATHDKDTSSNPPTILDESQCWTMLRGATVGRLAVVVDGLPDIFPVNFVVDHGSVVFRTATGTKLEGAIQPNGVAFEVDGFDELACEAWSVVARGPAVRVSNADQLIDTISLPLHPLQPDAKPLFVRLVPTEMSGRRFHVADPERWANPLSGAVRTAPE